MYCIEMWVIPRACFVVADCKGRGGLCLCLLTVNAFEVGKYSLREACIEIEVWLLD